jgi:hypothetical protein
MEEGQNDTVLPATLSPLHYAMGKEDLMSRQGASTIYLDNLLVFHGKSHIFLEAEHVLTEDENQLLRSAVSVRPRDDEPFNNDQEEFFLAIIMIMNININKEDAACASH